METIRVHPKGFKFLFYLYHGSAGVGFVLVAGFLLKIIRYDIAIIIGFLMISIPFLLAPPELIILVRDQKIIFRHRIYSTTISFSNISRLTTSACSVEIKNYENNTLLKIQKEHFKNIDLSDLSEYLRTLLTGHQKVDPMKYTSVKFTGCKFINWCKSVLFKTAMKFKSFEKLK